MTAEVLPFPLARRRNYVRRQGSLIATYSEIGAVNYLRNQMNVQRAELVRKGIAADVVERDLREAVSAIYAEAYRLSKGGAA